MEKMIEFYVTLILYRKNHVHFSKTFVSFSLCIFYMKNCINDVFAKCLLIFILQAIDFWVEKAINPG